MPPPPFPSCKTLRLLIHGRVQGVYFRDSMRREAQSLSISGWVRNRSDGTVEAVVQGQADAVDAIVRWAQCGPQLAQVARVEMEPASGSYSVFEITD
ncbi:acylphosphatase [Sideroxyarcus emersonii]|uniref:Acylphosphatase n=1 Tax=Sideroxyarcus emersonii TaxID=2764705 RepID=A0AAN1XCG3_9PROT|nr:acylphosphatase [Sideroxyarcus emersonii]BCK88744.1 acylphosphatase [Sideroxyarcus emersonii]